MSESLKWLVWGHKGWIGGMVVDLLKNNGQTVLLAESRADDEFAVEEEIKARHPDRLIALIGRTHGGGFTTIDYLEQPGTLKINLRDNLYSPLVLANLAQKYDLHFTYLGTGCIFAYDDPTNPDLTQQFTEESKPNFFDSSYSTAKGFTDRLMHLYDQHVLNVRIRMPIATEPCQRNLITKLTGYEKICSIPNSMTVLPELLPMMLEMASNKTTGTINLTNPGVISHNEILDLYREIVDPTFTYKNFSLEEQAKVLAGGRSNNFLATDKLQSLYPEVKDIKTSLKEVLKEYKQRLHNSK